MRLLLAVLACLVLASSPAQAAFGSGPFSARSYDVPTPSASEPTIGIPWDTDSLFYHEAVHTWRAKWAGDEPSWDDVTPPYQVPTNLDPMLVADVDTGRVFAGGLLGPCSVMMYSDDDGETWLPTINMCSGKDFDHQSIGLGPPAGPIPGLQEGRHVGYYCGQGGTISCARSLDEGSTWGPFQQVPGSCGGFHGHIMVSPLTGLAVVPTASCGQHAGYITTADGGVTWTSHEVPLSEEWTRGFDPAVQFTRPGGWMYYGMASEHGVHVALTKDEGTTWQVLGRGMGDGSKASAWLDVGQFHDPPIVSGTFTNVQAGDDDRAVVSFLGLEGAPGANLTLLKSEDIYQCDEHQEELVWRLYVARTFDAGATWSVDRVSDDPVQLGGIWDGGGGQPCRNLLDFNDMDIDSHGRIHIGIADGCTDECARTLDPKAKGFRDNAAVVFRQVGGRGLFAKDDVPVAQDLDRDGIEDATDPDVDGDGIPNAQDGQPSGTSQAPKGSPALGPVTSMLALACLAAVAGRRRR